MRIQFSDSDPATPTEPPPAPLTAKLQIWASRMSSSVDRATVGKAPARSTWASTLTSPWLTLTVVPASSMRADTSLRMSLVAEATDAATAPAPAAAPATTIMTGVTLAETSTPEYATRSAPLTTSARTMLRMKLIEIEPPTATVPAPAAPTVTLIRLALSSAATLTEPVVAVTLALST